MFLETNTKLKQFDTNRRVLWVNRDLLIDTNIQLDLFTIHFNRSTNSRQCVQIFDLLNKLYVHGFYKMLCLLFKSGKINNGVDHLSNTLAAIPALQQVYTNLNTIFALSRLMNINELRLCDLYGMDVELVARSLVNLERWSIIFANFNEFLPFIHYSRGLRTIRIKNWFNYDASDLFAANEERKKLTNPHQILLYLPEWIYTCQKFEFD